MPRCVYITQRADETSQSHAWGPYDVAMESVQFSTPDIVLMDGLEAHGVTSAELSAEATDSFRSSFSTEDRLSVEESRFHLLEYE